MKKYEKIAKEIATEVHMGQYRKDGVTPYITHPEAVAKNFETDKYKAVAWLHDALEMSNLTTEELTAKGLPWEIILNVTMLTHVKGMNYTQYIKNLKFFKIAKAVKLADIAHNYKTATPKQKEKYKKAIKILIDERR